MQWFRSAIATSLGQWAVRATFGKVPSVPPPLKKLSPPWCANERECHHASALQDWSRREEARLQDIALSWLSGPEFANLEREGDLEIWKENAIVAVARERDKFNKEREAARLGWAKLLLSALGVTGSLLAVVFAWQSSARDRLWSAVFEHQKMATDLLQRHSVERDSFETVHALLRSSKMYVPNCPYRQEPLGLLLMQRCRIESNGSKSVLFDRVDVIFSLSSRQDSTANAFFEFTKAKNALHRHPPQYDFVEKHFAHVRSEFARLEAICKCYEAHFQVLDQSLNRFDRWFYNIGEMASIRHETLPAEAVLVAAAIAANDTARQKKRTEELMFEAYVRSVLQYFSREPGALDFIQRVAGRNVSLPTTLEQKHLNAVLQSYEESKPKRVQSNRL